MCGLFKVELCLFFLSRSRNEITITHAQSYGQKHAAGGGAGLRAVRPTLYSDVLLKLPATMSSSADIRGILVNSP